MNPTDRIRLLIPEGEARDFRLQADYYAGHLDLKRFCSANPQHPVLGASPLVLEPQAGSFVFLSLFGGVVYWNCPEEVIREFHEELRALKGSNQLEERVRETLKVRVGMPNDSVGFSEIQIRNFTLENLRVVSLTVAQSVALDHFEDAVRQVMVSFQPVVRGLSRNGKLLAHREVIRIIGFALEVRVAVLDSLALFDDPPESWESESLSHLYNALFGQFDLARRLGSIREKLHYLQDAGATLLGLLDTRKNQELEWIVILLIFVELVLFVWKELQGALPLAR
jgi:uncharacterized Rmd1/YagE family protein